MPGRLATPPTARNWIADWKLYRLPEDKYCANSGSPGDISLLENAPHAEVGGDWPL